ncbi:MAG: ImmA/IrrE family metallo-endopeptidase [Actinomyces sp.]|nr:ImmA/IrrE family metallo-endopeptidase [Actinomyces sp.]
MNLQDSDRLNALLAVAVSEGVNVRFASNLHERGAYVHNTRTIYINAGMSERHRYATLAHELIHARLNHDGPQPESIEQRVNELAALMIVDVDEYRQAETVCGGHAGSIAAELDLPVWVIQAWQTHVLNRGGVVDQSTKYLLLAS